MCTQIKIQTNWVFVWLRYSRIQYMAYLQRSLCRLYSYLRLEPVITCTISRVLKQHIVLCYLNLFWFYSNYVLVLLGIHNLYARNNAIKINSFYYHCKPRPRLYIYKILMYLIQVVAFYLVACITRYYRIWLSYSKVCTLQYIHSIEGSVCHLKLSL